MTFQVLVKGKCLEKQLHNVFLFSFLKMTQIILTSIL